MTFVTPCQRPENDPDDWFIGRDGKQYADDEFVTSEEIEEIREGLFNSEHYTDIEAAIDDQVDKLESRRLKTALQKRRHARDKCHVECILRLQCLDAGLQPENLHHGTWGGYYSEERSQIDRLKREREARRNVPAEE